jgi:hypothetical protein
MRKLVYRGPEQLLRFQASSKNVYLFEAENKWTVEALTWADYYELICLDNSRQIIVDAEDTLASSDLRRKTIFDYEVPAEVYVKQRENEAREAEEKLYKSFVEQYKRSIMDRIASGTLEEFPADYEEQAIAFAKNKMAEREAARKAVETPAVEPVTTEEQPTEETPKAEPAQEETPETPTVEAPAEEEKPATEPVKKAKK